MTVWLSCSWPRPRWTGLLEPAATPAFHIRRAASLGTRGCTASSSASGGRACDPRCIEALRRTSPTRSCRWVVRSVGAGASGFLPCWTCPACRSDRACSGSSFAVWVSLPLMRGGARLVAFLLSDISRVCCLSASPGRISRSMRNDTGYAQPLRRNSLILKDYILDAPRQVRATRH